MICEPAASSRFSLKYLQGYRRNSGAQSAVNEWQSFIAANG
jgi:hypothetical protein